MKKILFLILFLAGICPVFNNNNGLYLGCNQVYGQEDPNGMETVIICPRDQISVSRDGDYLITESCSWENEGGIATNDCVKTCSEQSEYSPEIPIDPCSDPLNPDPECNQNNCGNASCSYGFVLNSSCECVEENPCTITCPEGQRVTPNCDCEEIPPPCNITYCSTGYNLINCECVKIVKPKDCAGVEGGSAYLASCGCIGGTTGKLDCCTPESIAAGATATSFFTNNVLQQSNNFSPFTFNQGQNEEWFSIEVNNGVIDAGPIITLTPNGGTPQISRDAIADVHTHTEGQNANARPSAEDLWGLGDSRTFASNFSDSYVIAFDGTKYDLHISDANLLAAFMTANGTFYDPNTNGFLPTSDLGKSFDKTYESLINNNPNMSIFEAEERAFAFILKGSGVDLLKANSGTNEFKKIDIVPAKNPDGTEKKDANGKPIYENADCN